jgi:hypothetical protein
MAKNVANPFDAGEAKPKPSAACLGVVESIDEPKVNDDGTATFAVNLKTVGVPPQGGNKPKVWIRVSPSFFSPTFKRASLRGVEGGDYLDRLYSESICAADGDEAIPHLLGLCGVDREKYAALGTELIALDGPEDPTVIKQVLEAHLLGNEVGFWLTQGSQRTDEVNPETGKNIWIRTRYYNVRAPKFISAAYFPPTEKGRKKVLDYVAKGADRVNAETGEPYNIAAFDETTVIGE